MLLFDYLNKLLLLKFCNDNLKKRKKNLIKFLTKKKLIKCYGSGQCLLGVNTENLKQKIYLLHIIKKKKFAQGLSKKKQTAW